MTVDDHLAVEEASAAELRGDWATAFDRHRRVPMFAESQHGAHLRLMADLGDAAPDWLRARFVSTLVRRWEGYGQPRRAGRVLGHVVPMVYPHGIPFDAIGCAHPEQLGAWIFSRDWVVRQADAYDLGGLQDLLHLPAAAGAIATAPRVAEWARAPMGGFRIVGADGAEMVVADAVTGEQVTLLDLGLTHHLEVGTHVLGRIVPTSHPPGRLFDWRPLPVDEETATAIARDPQRWLKILAARAHWRRLPQAFSHLSDSSLTADLPRHAWGALLGHPVDGLEQIPRTLAAHALFSVLGLDADVIRRQRHLVAELLLDEAVDEHTVTRFAAPSYRAGWQQLAAAVPSYARRWCDQALWLIDAATDEGLAG
ncbi:hypothetical protein [Nocardioides rubriscoriae]|uniref:hypothetical protein n=1 Tax=Nocardioides rubriscoriae TaxID=642762 RepID=UPI0011DF21BD|nr:hypothetical protein [Nocardioides rubriscoriae]